MAARLFTERNTGRSLVRFSSGKTLGEGPMRKLAEAMFAGVVTGDNSEALKVARRHNLGQRDIAELTALFFEKGADDDSVDRKTS